MIIDAYVLLAYAIIWTVFYFFLSQYIAELSRKKWTRWVQSEDSDDVLMQALEVIVNEIEDRMHDKLEQFQSSFFGSLGGKERGGTVTANRPYLVGEAGAELFVPNKTGTIVPNNRLGGGMGSGGMPVNITYNIQAFDSRDTLQAITENAPTISAIIETEFNKRGRRGFVT